ncbi:hypothetical protein PsAD2_04656 [Pseudovibrio axinellae]|uniref:Uncharacterized protein n=1 Tax=Pseudovibrio axinellae TaxID=989403 RepID=A0A161UGD6_9HYPH|nr:hypothetical protein [Pseudovibrio axinellae]KZL04573.1 hypothetical protein PsAD2_04656 [Pseudovibrio axinellae]SEQ72610.1 hypothetical protein SAMN05421798_10452 [Pseudovibrio axinellae]
MNVAPRRKLRAQKAPSAPQIEEVTLESLLNAQKKVARIIAAGNTQYLPIFQRLTKEVEEYKQKEDALQLALKLAAQ